LLLIYFYLFPLLSTQPHFPRGVSGILSSLGFNQLSYKGIILAPRYSIFPHEYKIPPLVLFLIFFPHTPFPILPPHFPLTSLYFAAPSFLLSLLLALHFPTFPLLYRYFLYFLISPPLHLPSTFLSPSFLLFSSLLLSFPFIFPPCPFIIPSVFPSCPFIFPSPFLGLQFFPPSVFPLSIIPHELIGVIE
jgi:hypothetical protein